MALIDVITCAPFRLNGPRPLTPYEWTVVDAALAQGGQDAGKSLLQKTAPEVRALRSAIQASPNAQRWQTSMFGPAPAVAPYAYRCLAGWFFGLDRQSQLRAGTDIATGKLLVDVNPPWAACATARQYMGTSAADLWEGSVQEGFWRQGAEGCAGPRQYIGYVPMTGQEMLSLFRSAGGQVPLELQQAEQYGKQFMQRSFLLGIEVNSNPPSLQEMGGLQNPIELARKLVHEMALIWAPSRGASIKFLLDDYIDARKVNGLIVQMMPDLLKDVLPGQLPGLLPPAGDPVWGQILGTAQQMLPWLQGMQGFGLGGFGMTSGLGSADGTVQPGTPPSTGVDIIDKPGDQLDDEPPPGIGDGGVPLWAWGLGFVGVAALTFAFIRS